MAACFVPRWLWVSECFALPKIQRRRVRPQTELGQGRSAHVRRLWNGTHRPTGFPADGCYRAVAGVGSERFAL